MKYLKLAKIHFMKKDILLYIMKIAIIRKGFCQVKKNQKIREKLGSGWVGQAPTRIIILFWKCCVFFVFCVVFMFPIFF